MNDIDALKEKVFRGELVTASEALRLKDAPLDSLRAAADAQKTVNSVPSLPSTTRERENILCWRQRRSWRMPWIKPGAACPGIPL